MTIAPRTGFGAPRLPSEPGARGSEPWLTHPRPERHNDRPLFRRRAVVSGGGRAVRAEIPGYRSARAVAPSVVPPRPSQGAGAVSIPSMDWSVTARSPATRRCGAAPRLGAAPGGPGMPWNAEMARESGLRKFFRDAQAGHVARVSLADRQGDFPRSPGPRGPIRPVLQPSTAQPESRPGLVAWVDALGRARGRPGRRLGGGRAGRPQFTIIQQRETRGRSNVSEGRMT
jgi:hypothetical protein